MSELLQIPALQTSISSDQLDAEFRDAQVAFETTPAEETPVLPFVNPIPNNSEASSLLAIDPIVEALRPVQQQTRIQCRLIRTIGIMETTFTLNIQNMRDDTERSIMQATKNLLRKDPKYIIKIFTQDGTKNDTILGRVKSNIIGTSFSIYEDDLQSGDVKDSEQVASVDYEPNLLGQRGPRKMSIIIPSMTNEGIRQEIQSDWKHLSLSERVQLGNELRQNLVLCNKPPQWNEETASFVLNFDGRVSMASVKNFQIIHEDDLDYIALQFGRVNDETFTVDIRYPFSLFQAFGIVLTSFDAKIACE